MASLGQDFDTGRKYKVVLSQRLSKKSVGKYKYASVQVDPELKVPSSIKSATLKPALRGQDECKLRLVGSANEKGAYKGVQQPSENYALVFNPALQSFTLDRVDTEFVISQEQASPTSEAQSDDGLVESLIEECGEPDPDNPYDWRHQLRRRRTPTPDLEPFDPLSLDALSTPPPEARKPKSRKQRQASSPPEEMNSPEAASPSVAREEEDPDGPESSDNGGLEIVFDEAEDHASRFRGRFTQRPGGEPRSLQSAASSRSPAMVPNESDESDVDAGGAKLGSPMREKAKAVEVEMEDVDADADADGEEEDEAGMEQDFEAEFEAEFERVMEEHNENDASLGVAAGSVPVVSHVEESSSESEEE